MSDKYALCVGNNYPGTNAALSGCVNDAHDWRDLLVSQGYGVTLLTETTKAHVLAELSSAVERLGFGDRLVFTYSGHGSWVRDRDGDEPDGRDECLVMADYMQGGLLTDDELDAVFRSRAYGSSILFLSDSCHSGSVNRFAGVDQPAGKPRFLSPAEFTDIAPAEVEAVDRALTKSVAASLISGCEDHEYSYDAWFGDRPNGAFTRAAIDAFIPGVSLARWHSSIRENFLPSKAYPQSPVLSPLSTYRKYTRAI
jgi:metacaspase-1